jgi:nucleotide-binding universal stress UspA family protein
MKMLIAIDGSKNSVRALKYAIKLADRLDEPSELVLVNAHDDIALRSASHFAGKDAVKSYLDDLSNEQLAEAVALVQKSGVTHEVRMVRGQVAQAIVKAATDRKCELIVLGSKGRSTIRDLMVGSVAQRVIALADVPVTLVK